ncbi:MAG: EF-hand domain-containing protein [Gemmataceae bacterium]|nr:EF-hand domain-containing protein [Gemmataceae bacterium]
MTRFLLLLLFASTAAAAPPAAPGLPRPTGPRGDSFLAGLAENVPVARPVRPKFELDPKAAFPDALQIVYLANTRPVRVRATITVNGQPLGELWRAHLKKLFDAFDRDRDGSLNRFEVDNIFSPKGLAGLLGGSYYHGAGDDGKTLADLDRDGDGRVSFAEFTAGYDEAAADLVRLRNVALDDTTDRELTKELFARLDANGDGKLAKDELANAENLLHALDTDENEALSAFEIRRTPVVRPGATPTVMSAERADPPKPDTSLRLYRGPIPDTLAAAMLAKYDANKDGQLTAMEIAFDAAIFAKLDANKDGKLAAAELDTWRALEPDFTAKVNLANDIQKRSAELTPREGKLPANCELRTGEKGRVVLRIGNQLLDLSTASPPPGAVAQRVTDQLNGAFPPDQKFVTENTIGGPQYQFLRVVFDSADANGDGKLTREEFKAYLQLQEDTIQLALTASFGTRRPSLFQLMDDNGDNQLGVRELRTAYERLIVLEPSGGDVTPAALQPSASVRFGFAAFLTSDYTAPINPFARPGSRKVTGPLWFRKMDRNGDNDVSQAEFIGPLEKFRDLDADQDGLISAAEADAADKKLRGKK